MTKIAPRQKKTSVTTSHEGGKAYSMTLPLKFMTRVMTCLYKEPRFYGGDENDFASLVVSMLERDALFVLKTAVFAREKMYLRTVPVYLLGMYFLTRGATAEFETAAGRILSRPDQLLELFGYLLSADRKKTLGSKALRRIAENKLNYFDEYRFAKYHASSYSVQLRDLIILTHPKPKDDAQSALFKACLDNKISPPQTWEVMYSEAKSNDEKAAVWGTLMGKGKLPYMAALRNLRNMAKVCDTHFLSLVGEMIADPGLVAKSKQFPFRFYSAYRMLERVGDLNTNILLPYVDRALEASVANLNQLSGVTYTCADNSASMFQSVSKKSSVTMTEIANVFQAMMVKASTAVASVFGTHHKRVGVNKGGSILTMASKFCDVEVGYGTNGFLIFDDINRSGISPDRVIIFSDMQFHPSYIGFDSHGIKAFRNRCPEAWVHWVDLAGYGNMPEPEHGEKLNLISGWSENVLRYIAAVEAGADSMLKDVSKIEL